MKRILALLLAVALPVVGLMSACGSSGTTDTGSTETKASSDDKITVWSWDPNFNIAVMNEAATAYKKINPDVEIEVVEMAKADVEQKLHTTLASKATDGLPDIVLIEDYNAQKYLTSYPGSFTDLTDQLDYSQFAEYKTGVMTVDGKKYGVPFDSGVTGLFYRSDILEEAGFTADDLNDITWDQYIEIGKTVQEKTGKYMMGFDKVDGGLMRAMMQSSGEWYFDANGQSVVATSPVIKESLEIYKKLVDSGVTKPTNGWNEWVSAFNSGESASVPTGIWIIGSIKAAEDQSGKWAVAPIPRLTNTKSINASNLGGSSWYLPVGTKGNAAAIEFMKTIYGQDQEFYQTILTNNGAMGAYLPAFNGSAYTEKDTFFGGNEIYKDLSTWLGEIPSVDYGSYTYEADAAIMAQVDAYVAGSITVEEALNNAQKQIENQIQ